MPDFLLPLGPFHIVFLHLPIGALVALWFVLFVLPEQGRKDQVSVVGLLHLFLLFSTAAAIGLGLVYEVSGQYGDEVDQHELWGYLFGAAVVLNYLFYWVHRKLGKLGSKLLYGLSLIVATIAMTVAGHLGGEMVHGKGFLTKSISAKPPEPEAVEAVATAGAVPVAVDEAVADPPRRVVLPKPIQTAVPAANDLAMNEEVGMEMGMDSGMGMEMAAVNTPPMSPTVETPDAAIELFEAAHLVMKNNCFNCHGATKQKGGLRLDLQGTAFEGGKNDGPSILAHDPDGSAVIQRMRLTRDDDDVMPPESKQPVSAAGLEALTAWIQAGAYWPDARALAAPRKSFVAVVDVATSELIAALNTTGAKAEYNSWDDLRVRVDLSFTDEDKLASALSQLNAFGDKLIWLDASRLDLPKSFFQEISRFKNLERLHFDGTNVSDADLTSLQKLSRLSYLNLFDTQVSDQAVEALKTLPNLQKVFLGQTKVTRAGVNAFAAAKPEVEVVAR